MNGSTFFAVSSAGVILAVLHGQALGAQPGGAPALPITLPGVGIGFHGNGPVPPPYVAPQSPAVLPSSVAPPSQNPVGTALNPPGLLSTSAGAGGSGYVADGGSGEFGASSLSQMAPELLSSGAAFPDTGDQRRQKDLRALPSCE